MCVQDKGAGSYMAWACGGSVAAAHYADLQRIRRTRAPANIPCAGAYRSRDRYHGMRERNPLHRFRERVDDVAQRFAEVISSADRQRQSEVPLENWIPRM